MNQSSIEWTGGTWNPFKGCSKVSQGCKYCYAEVMAKRLKAMGQPLYQDVVDDRGWTGKVMLDEKALNEPYRWKKPRVVFASMTDLFHENAPDEWVDRVMSTVAMNPIHTFLILSKRPSRFFKFHMHINGLQNLWIGTSIEDQKSADERLPHLANFQQTFVSYEPALGIVDFSASFQRHKPGVIIMGGESGPNARPIKMFWVRYAKRQCNDHRVAFFLKQLGTSISEPPLNGIPVWLKLADRKGGDPSEWPPDLQNDQDVARLPWGDRLEVAV